jgi:hypothetical protein
VVSVLLQEILQSIPCTSENSAVFLEILVILQNLPYEPGNYEAFYRKFCRVFLEPQAILGSILNLRKFFSVSFLLQDICRVYYIVLEKASQIIRVLQEVLHGLSCALGKLSGSLLYPRKFFRTVTARYDGPTRPPRIELSPV